MGTGIRIAAFQVLRPGGRFLCLEFSHVNVPGLRELYDAYSLNVIPKIGRCAGHKSALLPPSYCSAALCKVVHHLASASSPSDVF